MARKGISMEINAISTILFLAIVLGIIGYYALQNILKRRSAKRGAMRKNFSVNYRCHCSRIDMFRNKSLV